MRVNLGGGPGQDDYGLPPAGMQIPDDARELDADVQAYHRELRAQRRQRVLRRLHGPLTRDGMVLPLLAGCLALTLLTGTLLTVFTASGPMVPPARQAGGTAASQSPTQARAGQALPNADVRLGGAAVPLGSLRTLVLALVPPGCRCQRALGALSRQADGLAIPLYVIGVGGAPVTALATGVGVPASRAGQDTSNALASRYRPDGLTAIVVRADGTVGISAAVQGHGAAIESALRALAPSPSPAGSAGA